MNITFKNTNTTEAACEIIFVINEKFETNSDLETLNFEGKEEQTALLLNINTLYVGVGKLDADNLRLACAYALDALKKTNYTSAKVLNTFSKDKYVQALAEGFELASYTFDRYKTDAKKRTLKDIYICDETHDMHEAIKNGCVIAEATNLTKEVVNQTPDDITPVKMALFADDMANDLENVSCDIYDEHFLKDQKMGAFLAVARSSAQKPRLIKLTYKPQNPKAKVAIIGKGLTYDSGGLSLKPADYMVTMKSDKSGGSAVLGIIQAVSRLGLDVEVHGIIGATENMIGGDSFKPDDVLVAKNGKTIEIRNTDAEGRLVLADCLSYACETPDYDYIFDIATLTGACVVAVGEYTTGIMGHNNSLKHDILKASAKSGELTSTLSFNRYLKKLIKSEIADVCNIASSRYGGAITAGLFLNEFVSDEYKDKWCHFDIAGPAYVEKPWGYNQHGASGASVRTITYWLENLAK